MRWTWVALLCGLMAGCRGGPKGPAENPPRGVTGPPSTNHALIVTPSGAVRGRIVVVNPVQRYVIVSHPLGHVPQPERRMGVYRNGLKVGEIKIGSQRLDTNAVADITAGDCQVGDEVRAE